MAKVVQYMLTTVGLMLLLSLVGLPTFSSALVNGILGTGGDITIFNGAFLLVGVSVTLSIILAFFALSQAMQSLLPGVFRPPESVFVATLCIPLLGWFVTDVWSVITLANSMGSFAGPVRALMILIFVPYTIAFMFSIVAYWRGNDI